MVVRISERFGRGDWIRTSDPLRPRQVRYQAALRPDSNFLIFYRSCEPAMIQLSPNAPRTRDCRKIFGDANQRIIGILTIALLRSRCSERDARVVEYCPRTAENRL